MLSKEHKPLQVETHLKARRQRKKNLNYHVVALYVNQLMEAGKREYWGFSVFVYMEQ